MLNLENNPRLLQEVGSHAGTDDMEALVKVDLDILPKTTRVVVAGSLGVTWMDSEEVKLWKHEMKSFMEI